MSLSHILSSRTGATTSTGQASSVGMSPIHSITVPSIKSGSILDYSIVSTGSSTISVAASSMVSGISYFSGSTSAATWTPPTAPIMYVFLVSQGVAPVIGSSFTHQIVNGNTSSGAVTPQSGSGSTISYVSNASGTPAIAVTTTKTLVWVFTAIGSSATATIYY